jgi:hypothetical protein
MKSNADSLIKLARFALGYFVGEMVEKSWHKHDRD